jgi:hypothetical protein
MEIKIITAFKNALDYIIQAELNNYDSSNLWYKHMVDPFWNDLAKWASFNISNRKPAPIKNINTLNASPPVGGLGYVRLCHSLRSPPIPHSATVCQPCLWFAKPLYGLANHRFKTGNVRRDRG